MPVSQGGQESDHVLKTRLLCGLVSTSAPHYREYCDGISNQIEGGYHRAGNSVIVISWFQESPPRTTHECSVSAEGEIREMRHVYDWAHQGGGGKKLDTEALRTFRHEVARLPEGLAVPSVKQVLIVSFSKDDAWMTYSYDRKNLPPGVANIVNRLCAPEVTIQ